jgi:hypothetical protein
MFDVETKEIRQLARAVKDINDVAFPIANATALNNAAFEARTVYQGEADSSMTLRNNQTKRSVQVNKARGRVIRTQEAVVGSTEQYMEDREFGSTEMAEGKHGVPLATSWAAGQEKARPRTKLVRKANRMRSIHITGRNRQQSNVRTVQEAVKTGKRYVFLESKVKRKKGIFKVLGGRKKFKSGWPPGARLKLVWDLTHKTVTTPPNPMLKRTVDKVYRRMPEFYIKALKFQLDRVHKVG